MQPGSVLYDSLFLQAISSAAAVCLLLPKGEISTLPVLLQGPDGPALGVGGMLLNALELYPSTEAKCSS